MKFTSPATLIQSISCHPGSWSLDMCAGVLAGMHHLVADSSLGGNGLDRNPLNASYPVNGKQRKSFTDSLSRMEQRPATVPATILGIISEQLRQLRSGRYRLKPTPLT